MYMPQKQGGRQIQGRGKLLDGLDRSCVKMQLEISSSIERGSKNVPSQTETRTLTYLV